MPFMRFIVRALCSGTKLTELLWIIYHARQPVGTWWYSGLEASTLTFIWRSLVSVHRSLASATDFERVRSFYSFGCGAIFNHPCSQLLPLIVSLPTCFVSQSESPMIQASHLSNKYLQTAFKRSSNPSPPKKVKRNTNVPCEKARNQLKIWMSLNADVIWSDVWWRHVI